MEVASLAVSASERASLPPFLEVDLFRLGKDESGLDRKRGGGGRWAFASMFFSPPSQSAEGSVRPHRQWGEETLKRIKVPALGRDQPPQIGF